MTATAEDGAVRSPWEEVVEVVLTVTGGLGRPKAARHRRTLPACLPANCLRTAFPSKLQTRPGQLLLALCDRAEKVPQLGI